ncbi:hypothetical protein FIBSPDRAFT_869334 [Athelia psychrophila]|uniref:Uncharacterized protein n=1 Tax=Athelia psychrophila TaxID=1759441 RepID=A0A167X245_9AGAM|nr:hypothetical protein FIBSPDRAFT_876236 [Fibularhizoctonia sp. CBS 109695]KZP13504.1 hypothetical protein FIBSPDRAFT_869334 [Fibularhizoctonia sp. CBS 109695]
MVWSLELYVKGQRLLSLVSLGVSVGLIIDNECRTLGSRGVTEAKSAQSNRGAAEDGMEKRAVSGWKSSSTPVFKL